MIYEDMTQDPDEILRKNPTIGLSRDEVQRGIEHQKMLKEQAARISEIIGYANTYSLDLAKVKDAELDSWFKAAINFRASYSSSINGAAETVDAIRTNMIGKSISAEDAFTAFKSAVELARAAAKPANK